MTEEQRNLLGSAIIDGREVFIREVVLVGDIGQTIMTLPIGKVMTYGDSLNIDFGPDGTESEEPEQIYEIYGPTSDDPRTHIPEES
jgi:hypothetical protein